MGACFLTGDAGAQSTTRLLFPGLGAGGGSGAAGRIGVLREAEQTLREQQTLCESLSAGETDAGISSLLLTRGRELAATRLEVKKTNFIYSYSACFMHTVTLNMYVFLEYVRGVPVYYRVIRIRVAGRDAARGVPPLEYEGSNTGFYSYSACVIMYTVTLDMYVVPSNIEWFVLLWLAAMRLEVCDPSNWIRRITYRILFMLTPSRAYSPLGHYQR